MAVPGIWDTQCGFKAFTAEAADDIFKRCLMDRWGFDIEAMALVRKLNYQIKIIPIYWINNSDSRVSWNSYLNTFIELFKIKWNLIRKKYDQKKLK